MDPPFLREFSRAIWINHSRRQCIPLHCAFISLIRYSLAKFELEIWAHKESKLALCSMESTNFCSVESVSPIRRQKINNKIFLKVQKRSSTNVLYATMLHGETLLSFFCVWLNQIWGSSLSLALDGEEEKFKFLLKFVLEKFFFYFLTKYIRANIFTKLF
jgi:hypothetical protein